MNNDIPQRQMWIERKIPHAVKERDAIPDLLQSGWNTVLTEKELDMCNRATD